MPRCRAVRARGAGWPRSPRRRAGPAAASAATPETDPKSKATERLRPFSTSKKAGGPRRAPSGRAIDSTFTTVAPAPARMSPQSGPAHRADRSTTSASATSWAGVGPSATHSTAGMEAASPTAATGSPSSAARARRTSGSRSAKAASTASQTAGAVVGGTSSSSHAGTASMSVGARQRDGDPAIRGREEVTASPAADRPPAPEAHERGAFAQQRQRVHADERGAETFQSFDEPLRWAQRFLGVARSTPWHRSMPSVVPRSQTLRAG